MQKINLGLTDIQVSRLGLGTVKFGRNQAVKYPDSFELPSDKTIIELLHLAQTLGINLLDTAPAYGISEERLGKLLIGNRVDWIISTKVGEEFIGGESSYDFTSQHTRFSIERSLKRLKTDYLDIVLIHSGGQDLKIIQETDIFETLNELKQAGLIRSFGMSTKTVEGGKLALERSDLVMVTYNPVETAEKPVIEYAHQLNKGVFIKKGFASGHLDKITSSDPAKTSIDFIFQELGVTSLIVGTINPEHLKKNAQCLVEK